MRFVTAATMAVAMSWAASGATAGHGGSATLALDVARQAASNAASADATAASAVGTGRSSGSVSGGGGSAGSAVGPIAWEPAPFSVAPPEVAVGAATSSTAAGATAASAPAPRVGTEAAAASATDTVGPVVDEGDELADVRTAALARVTYPWADRLHGWTIEFLPERDGYLGVTWSKTHRVEIYVRIGESMDDVAFTLAHELGHAVDLTYLNSDDRAAWLKARGASGTPWWTDSGASDYAVGAGDFAEAFAVWQIGGTSLSTVAEQPDLAQLDLLATLALH